MRKLIIGPIDLLPKVSILAVSAMFVFLPSQQGFACQTSHSVAAGETLVEIARKYYKDAGKWAAIYDANKREVGGEAGQLIAGQKLQLPCEGQIAARPKPSAGFIKTASISTKRRNFPKIKSVIVAFSLTSKTGVGPSIGFASIEEVMIKVADRKEPALAVRVDLKNLTPGPHALHVHANAACGPALQDGKPVPGLAAGPHLYAYGTGAIDGVQFKSHLGDLPDLDVNADGTSTAQIIAPRLRLSDVRGRAIIIHASADDASSREACAIIP